MLAAFDRLHRMMLELVRTDPVGRWLMAVPGVGPATLAWEIIGKHLDSIYNRTMGCDDW